MWFKNLLGMSPAQQKSNQQNIDSTQFEIQQTNEDSSPLIDQSPDLRYQYLMDPKPEKIPFPHTLLDKSEVIIFCKVQPEDGFMCCSTYSSFTQVKIVCTDKQLLMSPNVFAYSKRSLNPNFLDVPLGEIQRIELKEVKKEPLKLCLTLKDNREIIFTNKLGDRIKLFWQKLVKFAQANGINKFFAFQYRKKWHKRPQSIQKGWQVYNIRKEFMRQGAYKHFSMDQHQKQFKYAYRIIKNHSFDISPTYPPQFFIPFNISKDQLIKAAKFRTRQRVPALSYFYQYKPESFSSLFRCSQIKTGVMGNRCQEDQSIVREIAQSSNFVSRTKKVYQKYNIKVYDARGYYAALGNMFAGKGYEKQDTYNCQVKFLDIPNIHAVRDSYCKVKSSSVEDKDGIYDVVQRSSWLEYVRLILTGAKEMAVDMINGKNVLVHCSDGWDRTAQLSSLCQLLLDPYYRTIQGLAVVIEKDWRSFGHKFRQRTGQYHPTSYHPYEKSPIFIQLLECIYQLLCQFPLSFQYNSSLLLFLSKHINSCIYGTFLTNNLKQSTQTRIQSETVSIWSDILFSQQNRQQFINPFYKQEVNFGFLNVSLEMKNFVIWRQHLFDQKQQDKEVPIFVYKKEKLINNALRQQFATNDQALRQLKKQLEALN